MRTAITLHRKKGTWHLAAGPDERSDKQWHSYRNIGANWPKDVDEVLFQFNDGKARRAISGKNIAQHIADAEKRAEEKLAIAKKRDADVAAANAAAAEARKKVDSEAAAKAIKAKEDAKKAPK